MDNLARKEDGAVHKLTEKNLPRIAARAAVPGYNRAAIQCGILHIGVGAFHRSHQALYMDDLFQLGNCRPWGICGVGILRSDLRMRDALWGQDCLYTLISRSGARDEARVVGALTEYLYGPDDPQLVLNRMAHPDIKILSLTITEGGYCCHEGSGEFNPEHPGIAFDLKNPHEPVTALGYITEALSRRRSRGVPPFTVLSCDNIQSNGAFARRMVLALARRRDEALAEWIAEKVAFPNSMVDRITPAVTEAEIRMVTEKFGIEDAWPVVAEPFRQWVVEDRFPLGRPDLERVGVQMTADVLPYELMKIRLLNAGHSAIGYLGYLAGYRYIHEIMQDHHFRKYLLRLMDEEVTPLLRPVPGVDLNAYKRTLLDRFANPAVADQAARICMHGSSKMPKFVLPSVREQLARGGPISGLSLAAAGWIRYLRGTDESGNRIEIRDPMAEKLLELGRRCGEDPAPLIGCREIFGELADSERFAGEVKRALEAVCRSGARSAVADFGGE